MASVKEYFKGLGTGVASLLKGLSVTGKEFVTPKITERYPENRMEMHVPKRFRADLQFIYNPDGRYRCTACGVCERSCPNGTITIESKMVELPDGRKKKKLVRYLYDLGSCTFCNLCVYNCPFTAIEFSNDFEQSTFTRGKLVQQLNNRPEVPDPEPTPEELAKMKAAKEAKIAAAKAAAARRDAPLARPQETAEPALTPAQQKALDAAAGDPDKLAKLKAAFAKAAALKAQREGAQAPGRDAPLARPQEAAQPALTPAQQKALDAAKDDPEKLAKLKEAFAKAAALKAQRDAQKQ